MTTARLLPPAAMALAFALALAACADTPVEVADRLSYASPFFGTGGFGYTHGSAFPGATAPNGLVKVGPDTSGPFATMVFIHYSGYWFGDDVVQGFSHLHMHGTGAADHGVLSVMPLPAFTSAMRTARGYQSKFDKAAEVASPGYYATTLENGGIRAELTATVRAAHHRYTYEPGATRGHVLFDLGHVLSDGRIDNAEIALFPEEKRIRGRLRSRGGMSRSYGGYDVFFEARTKQAWKSHVAWKAGLEPVAVDSLEGSVVGLDLEFDVSDGAPVELQVAVSFVSNEGAAANLAAELPAFEFDATRQATQAAWDARLVTARVFGGSEEQRKVFYSALHHAFMMPTVTSDADGAFRYSEKLGKAEGYRFLSDMSLWDTYRTLHPLYVLLTPDLALESARSLHEMAKLAGSYPKWPLATGETGAMLGNSAEIVLADAWVKGIRQFDAEGAYQLARAAALDVETPPGGRGGREDVAEYLSLGYVPSSSGRSVSTTTEYAHADFALSQWAAGLGHGDDAASLLERSRGYRKLFDPATRVLRARTATGELLAPFDVESWDHYAEANARQSVWMAAHDLDGFANLFGGREGMVAELSKFFDDSLAERAALPVVEPGDPPDRHVARYLVPPRFYWHGNEPDLQAAYMFAQAGRPDLTQQWLPWLRREFYDSSPDGLPGNDDGGTMSSWYVFSALGLFPLPGSDRYIVGAPLFPKAILRVVGGEFTIEAEDVSDQNVYVQGVELNGEELKVAELRHADLKAGGTLVFEMGPEPSAWGR